jgi:hypothetical protein
MSGDRESLHGPQCAVHSARLDRLESGQREIVESINGTLQAPGLRTEIAMLRQSMEGLRADMREQKDQNKRDADTEAARNAPAPRGAVQVAVLGAVLGACLALASGVALWEITQARAHSQAQSTHAH